jgi:dTDP-glucose pyrophosphorylase
MAIWLNPTSTLRDAVQLIEDLRRGIAAVTNEAGQLLGTLTDGDIRRCILNGGGLDTAVTQAMNASPLTAAEETSDRKILAMLRERKLEAVPVIDPSNHLVRIAHLRDLIPEAGEKGGAEGFAAAIIMAGGEGQRLRPLTETIPKPMVDVGGMPLIERHVRHLQRAGINQVFIAVNYLAEKIEQHFDNSSIDVKIDYLREEQKLGTAGALSLLPDLPDGPLLVFNSDVIHAADYANLLRFHHERGAALTVAAVEYYIQVPYGVIRVDEDRLVDLEEKPSERFLCNAGIYVLGETARRYISTDRAIDMTDIMLEMKSAGETISVFPLHEYWADVGDLADLERVRDEIWKLEEPHGR